MPDAYTYISKPTNSVYTDVNSQGREQYDQVDVQYDSSTTFYDGVDENAYTNVAKPTSSVYTMITKPTT